MTSLVILAVSVFEISCGKTDRHTDRRRQNPSPTNAIGVGCFYGMV